MAERNKKKRCSLYLPSLAALVGLTLAAWLWPQRTAAFIQPEFLFDRVLGPMLRMTLFMGLGLSAAMVVEALGWTAVLSRLAAPLTRRAQLPPQAAASFTLAMISIPAANGLLSEGRQAGRLTVSQLTVANLLNGSWPSFMVHLPSTVVVATSLAGLAGAAYVGIMFCAATLRLVGAVALGRLILPPAQAHEPGPAEVEPKKRLSEIWPGLRQRLWRRLTTLFSVALPVYFIISLTAELGFFEFLRLWSATHLPNFFLPAEAAALVVFSLTAEFSSGFAAAGALMESSSLSVPQAASALVLGNIIATPIRVLRWQLAAFLGYFQLPLGLILIFYNQSFRLVSLALSLWCFWKLFGA